MAMDGDDDMFAGMDFVTFSEDAAPPQPPHAQDLSIRDQPAPKNDANAHDSDAGVHADDDDADAASLRWIKPEQNRHSHSIDSILAAYDAPPASSSSSWTRQPAELPKEAPKPGIRRKKRGVRIGYGRIADDADHETRSSRHDETTSNNGGALDDQTSIGSSSSLHDDGNLSVDPLAKDMPHSDPIHDHRQGLDYGLNGVSDVNITTLDVSKMEVEIVENVTENAQAELPTTEGSPGLEEDDDKIHDRSILPESHVSTTISNHDECETNVSLTSSDSIKVPQINGNIEAFSERVNGHNEDSSLNDFATKETGIEFDMNVPSDLSIEERLAFIKSEIAANTQRVQDTIAAVSKARKAAAQKRRQATEKVSGTSAKLKQVEEEIEAACEREDFDKAESLNEALKIAEKAREEALQEFRDAELEYDKYATKVQEVMEMQAALEEKGCMFLDQLALEAVDVANHVKETAEEKGRKLMVELAAEEEAAKLKKKKLILEIQIVEEAKSELGDVIDSSIETELQEKSNLEKERQTLVEELDALLAAVKIKEAEIAAHDKQISNLDEIISSRVSGFEKESVGLGTELQNLSYLLKSLDRELEDLGTQKIQVGNEVTWAQAEVEKLIDLSGTVKTEAQKLQDVMRVRKNTVEAALLSKEKRLKLASEEKELVEIVQSLKNQSISVRTVIQELAAEKAQVQQEAVSATQKILSIEKRAPEIESEKRLAAASRNFKEAGRLANEAKVLLSSKAEVTSDLGRLTANLQKLDEEIEIRMLELADLDKQLLGKEKEAAMARCERLRLITAAIRDERDAAAELEDFEEAESLHLEAEAADKEADELQKEYGFEGAIYARTLSKAIRFTVTPNAEDSQILDEEAVKLEDANGTPQNLHDEAVELKDENGMVLEAEAERAEAL